ncbi:hypothetical protein LCGC14_0804980 [marine sediment metagenome]|uniref:Uncharacterized protein n=1 Tax=marine sediment metagenome TaxID=412755 RepID=A0A0F9Q8F1_9ZZZZ
MTDPDYTAQDVPTWAANLDSMNSLKAIGNIKNPLLHLPLLNSLAFARGLGSLTFARADSSPGGTLATYVDRYGVLQTAAIDEPRFEVNGLLIEGPSTNILLRSEDFSNAAWTKFAHTYTHNSTDIPSPRGGVDFTSSKVVMDGAGRLVLRQGSLTIAANDYSSSIWVYVPTGQPDIHVKTDLSDSVDVFQEVTEKDQWVHAKLVHGTAAGTETVLDVEIQTTAGGTLVAGVIVYIFGSHLEELPFVSSYIPTTTVPVTRTTDDLQLDHVGNSANSIFANETTLMDVCLLGVGITQALWSARGMQYHRAFHPSTGAIKVQWSNAGTQVSTGKTPIAGEITRISMVRELGGTVTGWADGIEGDNGSGDGIMVGTQTSIQIGASATAAIPTYGHLTNFRIYDRALSDREMAVA